MMATGQNLSEEDKRLRDVIASYGEGAAPFDAAMRTFMMRTLEPYFGEGPCLQVGCAHGEQTGLLLERFNDLTVIEPTSEFLNHTRDKYSERATFVQALIEDFETDKQFETIIFSHVLEHVIDPIGVITKLGELLTPTGRLYVVVPNAEAPSRRIAVKMGILSHLEALSADDIAAGHRRVYRQDTLLRDVMGAHLTAIDTGGIMFKPLANFQFNALMGGDLINDAFMEGCYQLGRETPASCASIYVVVGKKP
jgi:2-polyprenyl-3-methyl-5-hydroxy-6-metoxy-1,4-benzoquinol methylase